MWLRPGPVIVLSDSDDGVNAGFVSFCLSAELCIDSVVFVIASGWFFLTSSKQFALVLLVRVCLAATGSSGGILSSSRAVHSVLLDAHQ